MALNAELTLDTPPTYDVVSLDTLKTDLLIQHDGDDALLGRLLKRATAHIEGRLGFGLMEQIWVQTQDFAPSNYLLHRKPILSIESVEYIADDSLSAWTTLDSDYYYLAGNRVIARSAYPSLRSFAGWRTTFKVGFHAFTATPDDAEIATARAAVPSDIVGAIIQYTGHLYENKEGQGAEAKYEVAAKSYGALPANITLMLERHLNWRIKG